MAGTIQETGNYVSIKETVEKNIFLLFRLIQKILLQREKCIK